MLTDAIVEQRLDVLEREVADLRRRLSEPPAPADWIDTVTGSVTDEPAFLAALELGRAFRSADRPPDDADVGEPS